MTVPTDTELDALVRRSHELAARGRSLLELAEACTSRAMHPERHAFSIQPRSANPKLAPQLAVLARSGRTRFEPTGPYCVSTYASIAATCPSSCPFLDHGCFVQAGASHLTMGSLDRAGRQTTGIAVTLAEAAALERLWIGGVPQDGHRERGRDLRLHVGGDVSSELGAMALARAVSTLQARGLGSAWTYTHRWRQIPRSAWGSISVFASCETSTDVDQARERGYQVAITVEAFASRRAFRFGSVKAIPCPYEAGTGRTCVECRLCLDQRLAPDRAIAFAVHGARADRARTRLRVLQEGA